jgi:DNA-binding NtrC family response regulator
MAISGTRDKTPSILIVDSNSEEREATAKTVRGFGWGAESASDGAEALEILAESHIDVIVTELQMPRMNGIELLNRLQARERSLPVVVLAQNGGIEFGLRCVHEFGAFWYLDKPAKKGPLKAVLNAAIQAFVETKVQRLAAPFGIVGGSESMQRVCSLIEKAAKRDVTVFITGETGTGKELAAQAIHECSSRAKGPFVPINCAAVSESLLEAEFFGYERGAFTGASERRAGFFEQADKGTVLLDEIGELPLQFQAKLLRVLEDHKVRRVGGRTAVPFDFRVLVSTNRSADKLALRADLFYRLDCFHLVMPALRDHREDIPILIKHFLQELNRKHLTSVQRVASNVGERLARYTWPGNVRQLQHVLEEAIICADPAHELTLEHLPDTVRDEPLSHHNEAGV